MFTGTGCSSDLCDSVELAMVEAGQQQDVLLRLQPNSNGTVVVRCQMTIYDDREYNPRLRMYLTSNGNECVLSNHESGNGANCNEVQFSYDNDTIHIYYIDCNSVVNKSIVTCGVEVNSMRCFGGASGLIDGCDTVPPPPTTTTTSPEDPTTATTTTASPTPTSTTTASPRQTSMTTEKPTTTPEDNAITTATEQPTTDTTPEIIVSTDKAKGNNTCAGIGIDCKTFASVGGGLFAVCLVSVVIIILLMVIAKIKRSKRLANSTDKVNTPHVYQNDNIDDTTRAN